MRYARHNSGPFTIPRPARLRTIQTICKQIAQIARAYFAPAGRELKLFSKNNPPIHW